MSSSQWEEAVKEQELQIKLLSREVDMLKEQVVVLRTTLVDLGIIRMETFHAKLHRFRFSAVKEALCFSSQARFADVAEMPAFRSAVGRSLSQVDQIAFNMSSTISASNSASLESAPKIYIVGGSDGGVLSSLECYDLVADRWQALPSMPTERSEHSASVMAGKIYIVGGRGTDGVLNTSERYDPVIDRWQASPSILTARYSHSASVMAGKIYIVGGTDADDESGLVYDGALNDAECYDPVADRWQALPPMSAERYSHSASVMAGKLYIVGGYDAGGNHLNALESYDPVAGRWQALPPMPTARSEHSASVMAGKMYIVGGSDGGVLSSLECYDPVADRWEALPSILTARYSHSASVMAGKIYIVGGAWLGDRGGEWHGDVVNAPECYDPVADRWQALPPMSTARANHRAFVMAGKIYIVGGEDYYGPLNTLECYDPVADRWQALPPMSTTRFAHTVSVMA